MGPSRRERGAGRKIGISIYEEVGVTEEKSFRTNAIHSGEPRPPLCGSVVPPLFQGATYEFFGEPNEGPVRYARLSNTPNHVILNTKLATLEGGEAGLVTASGMAAISTSLLALIPPGGHLLAQENLYGGTFQFLNEDFPKLGRRVTFFGENDLADLGRFMEKDTRAIYVESVSNPLMKILDLNAVVSFARKNKLFSFVDNTFPSPVNFNPLALGFDIVLHSATKYLNGHTDVIAGAVIGRKEHVQLIGRLLKHLGGALDPFAAYLLNRGIKTLAVRVAYQNESALKLAQNLEKHPKIRAVAYPGLPSHPQHARAKELFRGFGGMLAFEYEGTGAEADRFLKRLKLPFVAPSLGGVETLVTRPVLTSHSWFSPEELKRQGVGESLVRVSVGIEDTQDLIEDFNSALKN